MKTASTLKRSTNYIAIDQYGTVERNLGPHPRRALLDRLGRQHADKVYRDTADGKTIHVGYIVAGRWFTLYQPVMNVVAA